MVKTNEKPGCLSVLFPFLRPKEKTVSGPLPYRTRDDFLSPAELSFYKVLSSLVGTRLVIQSKVGLADIFFVARPNENVVFKNRIAQKHLDFLVCEPATMKPVFGIELDDASHQREDRQRRDEFVDRVFEAAGLKLIHFPVQREYDPKEIAAQIKLALTGGSGLSPAPSRPPGDPAVSSVPLCPKCGTPMVLRTAAQGANAGRQFYGCQNYPRCREILPYTAR